MDKIKIDSNAFVNPMPMAIVGSIVDNNPNFMAVAWIARVNFSPPMIGIALGTHHYSVKGINENKAFSVNIPTIDLINETDYCGIVSGKDINKSELFELFYGDTGKAPMIKRCAINMECRLEKTVDLPSNTFFIGQIINAYSEEQYLTDAKPDIIKIAPFALTMPDNHYWSLGEKMADAWSIGGRIKEDA